MSVVGVYLVVGAAVGVLLHFLLERPLLARLTSLMGSGSGRSRASRASA